MVVGPTSFLGLNRDLHFTRVPATVDERRALSVDANGTSVVSLSFDEQMQALPFASA